MRNPVTFSELKHNMVIFLPDFDSRTNPNQSWTGCSPRSPIAASRLLSSVSSLVSYLPLAFPPLSAFSPRVDHTLRLRCGLRGAMKEDLRMAI